MESERIVAWQGPVQMVEAKWTDKDGSLVRLKLLAVNEAERNPFVKFTKRKGGKAGTRFRAAIVVGDEGQQLIYEDEAMLAGWNDSQSGGMTVTLWLAHDRMGHPFEGVSRESPLALVLVELDDDQQPIDQEARERVEAAGPRYRSPSERPSYAAAMLCKNPGFWDWIETIDPLPIGADSEEEAAKWLRATLSVGSRGELDHHPELERRFRQTIQLPFSTWLSERTKLPSGNFGARFHAIQA